MPHDPIGGDPGHERVGVMNARYFRSLSWSPPGNGSYFLSMTR
jgi:hypothetical protein